MRTNMALEGHGRPPAGAPSLESYRLDSGEEACLENRKRDRSSSLSPTAATTFIRTTTMNTALDLPEPPVNDLEIDFSLVYALHTFVATREGQVAVVRNEPLILLDDTNCYWWLVKPLHTNTIGYIPAEIVETPYERLARVNRQKNAELTEARSTDVAGGMVKVPIVREVAPEDGTWAAFKDAPDGSKKGVSFDAEPRWDYYVPESDGEEEEEVGVERSEDVGQVREAEVGTVRSEGEAGEDMEGKVEGGKEDQPSIASSETLQPVTGIPEGGETAGEDVPCGTESIRADHSPQQEQSCDTKEASMESTVPAASEESRETSPTPLSDVSAPEEGSSPDEQSEHEFDQNPGPERLSIQEVRMVLSPLDTDLGRSDRESSGGEKDSGSPASALDVRNSTESSSHSATVRIVSTSPVSMCASPTQTSFSTASDVEPIIVLRIYPGQSRIYQAAQFKTCVVNRSTTVSELLRQSLMKYRVFHPSKEGAGFGGRDGRDAEEEDAAADLNNDWFLSLQIGEEAHSLPGVERVVEQLEKFGQKMVASPVLHVGMSGGDRNADLPRDKSHEQATRASDNSPSRQSLPDGTSSPSPRRSQRPALQLLVPANLDQMRLKLNQRSIIERLRVASSKKLVRVALYDNGRDRHDQSGYHPHHQGDEKGHEPSIFDEHVWPHHKRGTVLRERREWRRPSPLGGKKKRLQQSNPDQPQSQYRQPVQQGFSQDGMDSTYASKGELRMVKTVKIEDGTKVEDVIRIALEKFAAIVDPHANSIKNNSHVSPATPSSSSSSSSSLSGDLRRACQKRLIGRPDEYCLLRGGSAGSVFEDSYEGIPELSPLCNSEEMFNIDQASAVTFILRKKTDMAPCLQEASTPTCSDRPWPATPCLPTRAETEAQAQQRKVSRQLSFSSLARRKHHQLLSKHQADSSYTCSSTTSLPTTATPKAHDSAVSLPQKHLSSPPPPA